MGRLTIRRLFPPIELSFVLACWTLPSGPSRLLFNVNERFVSISGRLNGCSLLRSVTADDNNFIGQSFVTECDRIQFGGIANDRQTEKRELV